jgi:6,7-dimethyl-8-ribityllumazine synthase
MDHILIVSGRFYDHICDELVRGASEFLNGKASFNVISVPGALEVPSVIRYAIAANSYDGFVALGCVIRGETSHYETVCHESARALSLLTLQFNAAIGNGILTVENEQQALVRANVNDGNKGAGAAAACLRLIELKKQFGLGRRP